MVQWSNAFSLENNHVIILCTYRNQNVNKNLYHSENLVDVF